MALEVFKLFGSIFINTDEADTSISKTEKKASSFKESLGKGIATAGKWGAAVVGGATAAAGALGTVAESTREYRTEMGKLDTAYSTSGYSTEAATKTYKNLYAVLGDSGQSVEAANHLAKLCDTENELQSWTDICTGVFATFGDSLPVEGLTEAANETAKVGQVTGPLADALNWAGVSEDEFNNKLAECSTEQERQQLITSTLTDLYSDASSQYKETNKDIMASNEAQATLSETMASLGATAEPILTKLATVGTQLLSALMPAIGVIATQLMPPFMQMIDSILPPLTELINMLIPPLTNIVTAILPIFTQLITMLVPPFVQIVEMILPLLTSLIEPLLPLLQPILQLLQPFIDLLLMLLQPLVELLNMILPPLVELLSNMLSAILPPLQAAFQGVANVLGSAFKTAFEFIKPIIESLKSAFSGIITFIKGVFTGDWKKAWEGIKTFFKGIWDAFYGIVKAPVNLIIDGINALWSGIYNAVKGIVDSIGGVAGALGDLFGQDWSFSMPEEPPLIPKLAKGGIVDKATTFVAGEDGAEAVIPLERNTEWTSTVAHHIKAETQQTQPRANTNDKSTIVINIEKFINNTEQDIDRLAELIDRKLAQKVQRRGVIFNA